MPAFNPQGFGSGFDGGVNTPASGAGAFYAGGFGAGFEGGADNSAGSGAAFDSAGFGAGFYGGVEGGTTTGAAFNPAAFGSGFYGGVNTPITGPLSLTLADIEAIAQAVWEYATRTLTSGGGSAPTAEQVATAVLAAAQATPIHADAKRMNGAQVVGTGAEGDAWRAASVPP